MSLVENLRSRKRKVGGWAGRLAAAGLGLALGACSSPPQLTPEQRDLNVRSFDQVWTTTRDSNFDPTMGGVDWEAAKTELRPKVQAATTMDGARKTMTDLLERLHQSHFGIIPGESYGEMAGDKPAAENESTGETGDTGIQLRAVNGEALVVRVDEGSTGEQAGVKPGWLLRSADGRTAREILAKIRKAKGETPQTLTYASFAFARLIHGEVGKSLSATFVDGAGREVTKSIPAAAPSGRPSRLGNLPTFYVDFRSQRLAGPAGDVGYFWFSAFLDPQHLMPKITAAIGSFADCKGIVIDLRGNPGGLGVMAMGVAGHFVPEQQKLGDMITRDGTMKFLIFPRANTYPGKVAILIDETSVSTSEILAGGMKDLGRARLFGSRTAGMALPSTIARLPNGDGFQYAFANYVSVGGKALEGDGVSPDVTAPPTRADLLAGRDNALEAAKAWILSGESEKQAR